MSAAARRTLWCRITIPRTGRQIFAPSIAQSNRNSEHLSRLLRELANTSICLREIGFGNWNYSGCVEPLRAAIEFGACLRDTAGAYSTPIITGRALQSECDPTH